MFTKKTISRIFSVWLVVVFMLATLPVQAMHIISTGNPASAAPADLLQFTSGGHALGFTAEGMYAATGSHALHVDFAGANAVRPQVPGQDKAATGTAADGNPDTTQGKAAPLSQVIYANLWKGISLTYTAQPGSIYTTTYTMAPEADPTDIRLRYNVLPSLNDDGTLSIAFETGTMTESAPVAWQEIKGQRVPVESAFKVKGEEVSFALGVYDPNHTLTIDPSLIWNTFLGGSGNDNGYDIAVDTSGNIYVTGTSANIWGTPVHAYSGGYDAFIAKLNSSGTLIWNTFLGGSGDDFGRSIAVSGNVYVTGYSSTTWGSPVRAYGSGNDVFVAQLNLGTGALIRNTFLGGSGDDRGYGIFLSSGNIFVTGFSDTGWVTPFPLNPYTGGYDAFAAQLDSTTLGLTWSTFLGGSGSEIGYGIAVDGSGNIFLTGMSNDTWGIPARAYTGSFDAFVAQLNSSGALVWNTFLGGSGDDEGNDIAVDIYGYVYVTGYSSASWGTPARAYTAETDIFAAKLDASTGALIWNTFVGGSGEERGCSLVMYAGNLYIAGYSGATWGTPARAYSANRDGFVTEVDSTGHLTWNTFLGGSGDDYAFGIAMNPTADGYAYVAGYSPATWGTPLNSYAGSWDAFAAKLNASTGVLAWSTFMGASGNDIGSGIAVDGSGNIYVTGGSNDSWGSPVQAHADGVNWDAFAAKLDASGHLVWNTFLGGSVRDYGKSLAVDGAGNVYVTGESDAAWGSPKRAYSSYTDVFVAKLDGSNGALTWNTFLGSSFYDPAGDVTVDGSGNVYVTGSSNDSWGCSSPACTVRAYTSGMDAFAAKINASNGTLIWNTFLGGSSSDYGEGVALDGNGNIFVTGASYGSWSCPVSCTVNAFLNGSDAFAAKLDASGGLTWNTFLGGSGLDEGNDIIVDGNGNVYVTGESDAAWGSPVRAYTGGWDAFAAKLDSSGHLAWNSFLGGSGKDLGMGAGVDGSGNVYVTGESAAAWGSPLRIYFAGVDAFAAKLSPSGGLIFNTFLGSTGDDHGYGVAVDGSANVYMVGDSTTDWGSPVRAYASGYDVFAVKLDFPPTVVSSLRADANPTNAASVHFTVNFNETVTGVDAADFTLTTSGISGAAIIGVGGSGSTYTVTVSTGSGTGTLRLDLVDNDTILDGVGQPLGGVGAGNGNYSSGETYSVRPPCYALSFAYSGSGGVTTASPTNSNSCVYGYYAAGEVITLTASPASGWAVGSWSGTNNDFSTSTTNSLTMPSSSRTVTVNYIQSCYALTRGHTGTGLEPAAVPSNSSGCSSGQYHAGETITLTASPEVGWTVSGWSGTINDFSTSMTNSAVMPARTWTVTVNYIQSCYALTRTYTGTGLEPTANPLQSSGCSSGWYHAGEVITLTASPASGWAVGSWSGTSDDGSTSITNSVIMPSGSHTVTANYVQNTYWIFLPLVIR